MHLNFKIRNIKQYSFISVVLLTTMHMEYCPLLFFIFQYELADLLSFIFSVLDSLCISSEIILITCHVGLKTLPSPSVQLHPNQILYSSCRSCTVQISYLVFPVCHSYQHFNNSFCEIRRVSLRYKASFLFYLLQQPIILLKYV